jgi:rod shape determining protein RodA
MRATIRPYKNIDWLTVSIYALLVAFGWLNIYAANYDPDNAAGMTLSSEPAKQLIWIGLSVIMIGILFLIDSKFFVEFAYIFFGISILLLILALLFGVEINGARAWFKIGPIRLQPAELTKVAAGLALARVMSRFNFRMSKPRHIAKMGMVVFLPAVIILLQNDTGSALVYFAFFLVFFREGMSPVVLFLGALAVLIMIGSLLYTTIFLMLGIFLLFSVYIYLNRKKRLAVISTGITVGGFLIIYGIGEIIDWDTGFVIPLIGGLAISTIYLFLQVLIKRLPQVGIALILLWGMIGNT